MIAPFIAKSLRNRGKWLIIGLCLAQGILVYGLTSVSIWAVLAAAAAVCFSGLIAIISAARRNGASGRRLQHDSYDETIEQFFYVLKSDLHGRFIDANDKYLARIGYTLQELSELPTSRRRAGHYETSAVSEMWASVRTG